MPYTVTTIGEAETAINALDTRVSALESSVSTLQGQMSTLLGTTVPALQLADTTLDERLDAIEGGRLRLGTAVQLFRRLGRGR